MDSKETTSRDDELKRITASRDNWKLIAIIGLGGCSYFLYSAFMRGASSCLC